MSVDKNEVLKQFIATRNYTEKIVEPLAVGDFESQPVEWVSPPKWHLGHTTWFFEQFLLAESISDYKWFDDDFAFLFNSYYNTIGKRVLRTDRGNLTRPIIEEVFTYRKEITLRMTNWMSDNELSDQQLKLIELGINHEQQHQELLITDIKYILGHNPLFPVYDGIAKVEIENVTSQEWISLKEGIYSIGNEGEKFCYDNELSKHQVFLHEFEISNRLVSNGDFIEFIEAGGYTNFDYWLDEGWAWVKEKKVNSPKYWFQENGDWFHYTLAGYKKVQPNDVLCHVSYYEAVAYAEWKGMRLPTEYEWEAASDKLDWGSRWEWCASSYMPYPGFDKPEGAVGEYNGKFMVNQMVLRGSSAATAPNHSRKTYRNFFHPHFQWQFSGIRLAKKQKI